VPFKKVDMYICNGTKYFFGLHKYMSISAFTGPVVFQQNTKYKDTTSTSIFTTTNTVPVQSFTVVTDPTQNETFIFDGSYTGYISAGSGLHNSVYIRYIVMIKNLLGVITVYKEPSNNYPMSIIRDGDSSLDACSVNSVVAGSNVNIQVTGLAMTQLTWASTFRLVKLVH